MNTKKCVSFQFLTWVLIYRSYQTFIAIILVTVMMLMVIKNPWLVLMVNRDDGSAVVVVAVAL